MKMNILSGGELQMKKHIYVPDTEDRLETIEIPVSCYLLRHPQGNVLFDTGCHPSIATDPAARWGGLERAMVPKHSPGQDVISELGKVGLQPEDIDLVINSHLHTDHCGCNEFFINASFFAHQKELETARASEIDGNGYFRADWDHATSFEAITAQKDVFNDGRIILIPLPGHTAGMMCALVNLDRDGAFFLASDAVSLKINLDEEMVPKNTWQGDLLLKSYDEIRKIERAGAQIICGHDAEQLAHLKRGLDGYA